MSESGNIAHDKYVSTPTETEGAFWDTVRSGLEMSASGWIIKQPSSLSWEAERPLLNSCSEHGSHSQPVLKRFLRLPFNQSFLQPFSAHKSQSTDEETEVQGGDMTWLTQ